MMPRRYQPLAGLLNLLGGNQPILGLQPPYGLMHLSACLKRDGHQVELLDGLRSTENAILSKIQEWRPGLVGLSCVTWSWSAGQRLAHTIRARFPGVALAVGGAHVNAERGRVLEECPDFDFACFGDAEDTFSQLVAALEQGREVPPLDGLAFRDASGRVLASPRDALVRDLDRLPLPDRAALGLAPYRPSPQSYRRLPFAAVFGSRGCPGRCTFCHSDARVRLRSAASLVNEIEALQAEHGVREVLFYDENFTLNRRRALEFCELLLERGVRLSWAANARLDGLDPELLNSMRRAGCWRLLIGIESGSQRLLDRMQKGLTLEQVRRGVALIRASGIQSYGMFILGFPTETFEEGLQTIAFMKELPLDFVNVAALTPFPGTAVYAEVRHEAGFKGFDHMNMYDVSYVPASMSQAQLEELLRRAMREFYLRPGYALGQVRHLRSLTDLARYAQGCAVVLLR